MPDQTSLSFDDSVVSKIVNAVIDETDATFASLPPLYDVVDPDALNDLMAHSRRNSGAEIALTFEFAECNVHVSSHDGVTVSNASVGWDGEEEQTCTDHDTGTPRHIGADVTGRPDNTRD